MREKTRSAAIGALLALTLACAQGQAPRLDRIAADEIPRDVVAALAQDRDGFLWVATGDGLARFDGLRLLPRELPGHHAGPRNLGWVRALLGGRDGRVWIGTETRGLVYHDPRDEQVHLTQPPRPDGQPHPTLLALAEDHDGAIWAGGQSGGLLRHPVDGGRQRVWRADGRPGSLPDDAIHALRVTRDGTLWLGYGGGLARRPPGPDTGFEDAAPELAGQRVQALLQTSDGAVWAGTAQGGLLRLGADGARRWLAAGEAGAVTALAEPRPGVVWVGRSRGIELRDAARGERRQWLRHEPQAVDGLAADAVTALLAEPGGVVWIGGLGLGLQRGDLAAPALHVRSADADPASPLARASVLALLARRDGRIWAATEAGTLAVLDAQLRTRGRGPRTDSPVLTMAQQADGRIWLGLEGALLEVGTDDRIRRRLAFAGGTARRLLPARDGSLWLAAADGLWRLPRDGQALQRMAGPDGRPLRGEVHALVEDPDGTLWVATSNGLLRLAPGAAALSVVASPPGAGLGHPVVLALLRDRQGRLWLETAVSGLHRMTQWDGQLARFDRISERLGAAGRPFGANLMEDRRGRLWTQMHVYDPATDQLVRLGPADGVRIGMPWFFSHTQLADGRMLFGGTRGLLVVQPAAWEPRQAPPTLRLSGLLLGDQRLPVRAALDRPEGLALPAAPHRLVAEIGLLGVADARQHRYEYRIDGVDEAWRLSQPGQRQIELTNLPPGDTRLRLRAGPGAAELTLPLRVAAPWWRTPWAAAGALLLVAAAVAAAVGWRTRHLLARQRELEQHVRDRTQALEEASLTDPLTGLRNRRYLIERIDGDCAAARRRSGQPESDLLFFLADIDHFKALNDNHGHATGDAVLAQMRERLQAVFRAGDALVRWGGEEFLVVARDSERSHAGELADRLRRQVADRPFDTPAGPLTVTCSVGVAAYPPPPGVADGGWPATLSAADAALYEAKQAGRNTWRARGLG